MNNDSTPVDPSGLLSIARRPFHSVPGEEMRTSALLHSIPTAQIKDALVNDDSTPVDPSRLLSVAQSSFFSVADERTRPSTPPAQLPSSPQAFTDELPTILVAKDKETTDPSGRLFASNMPGIFINGALPGRSDWSALLPAANQGPLLPPANNLPTAPTSAREEKGKLPGMAPSSKTLATHPWRSSRAMVPPGFGRLAPISPWHRPLRLWIGLISAGLALILLVSFGAIAMQMLKKDTNKANRANIPLVTPFSSENTPSTTGNLTPSVSAQKPTPVATPAPKPTPISTPKLTSTPHPTSAPGSTPAPGPTSTPGLTPTPTYTVSHQTIVDNLSDWSLTYSHTANLGFDMNNSQWMGGDTSLLYRETNTAEAVAWKLSGLSSFQAVVYFWTPQSSSPLSSLGVSTSSDGVHWTNVTPIVSGGGGNWVKYTYTLNNLSNVNFVMMHWSVNANHDWAQQIGQVTLKS